MKVCALIPAYNCGRTIGTVVNALKAKGLDVIVVDDGSTDDTAAKAESGGAVVISHQKNMGKGAAIREGFKYALGDDYTDVLVMDGDDQHRAQDVDGFISMEERTGAGLIIGNRMGDATGMPPVRLWTNRFMSGLISLIIGQRVPDTQCGFRLLNRGLLEALEFESSNYDIESEMIIKASRAGFKIESVPIKTVYAGEKSSINPVVDTLRFLSLLARILFRPKPKR